MTFAVASAQGLWPTMPHMLGQQAGGIGANGSPLGSGLDVAAQNCRRLWGGVLDASMEVAARRVAGLLEVRHNVVLQMGEVILDSFCICSNHTGDRRVCSVGCQALSMPHLQTQALVTSLHQFQGTEEVVLVPLSLALSGHGPRTDAGCLWIEARHKDAALS
eukprot:2717274-Amphidinium_carterae.1